MATVSRIDEIIGLFCRIASLLWVSFAKETYNFIDPTSCSHPISENKATKQTHFAMSQTLGWQCAAMCHSVLQCVAVCCSVLQCRVSGTRMALYCSVLQCVAVCCSVM